MQSESFTQMILPQRSPGQTPSDFLDDWFAKANGSGTLDATLLTDQMTYLPNDLLVKVDIASMANSLEARSPFLDHKLIEFAASLPENLKMRRLRDKIAAEKSRGAAGPAEVIYRQKMGFGVPIGKWFRGEMKDFVRDVLLSEKSLKRGIVRPEMVETIRQRTHQRRTRPCIPDLDAADARALVPAIYRSPMTSNIDNQVVAGFGDEWSRFDQSALSR